MNGVGYHVSFSKNSRSPIKKSYSGNYRTSLACRALLHSGRFIVSFLEHVVSFHDGYLIFDRCSSKYVIASFNDMPGNKAFMSNNGIFSSPKIVSVFSLSSYPFRIPLKLLAHRSFTEGIMLSCIMLPCWGVCRCCDLKHLVV